MRSSQRAKKIVLNHLVITLNWKLKTPLISFFVLALKPMLKTHIKGYFRGKERALVVL